MFHVYKLYIISHKLKFNTGYVIDNGVKFFPHAAPANALNLNNKMLKFEMIGFNFSALVSVKLTHYLFFGLKSLYSLTWRLRSTFLRKGWSSCVMDKTVFWKWPRLLLPKKKKKQSSRLRYIDWKLRYWYIDYLIRFEP